MSATFEQAQALFSSGELEKAALLCQQLLQLQSDHDKALTLLGLVSLQSDDPQRAFECAEQALVVNPKSAWSYLIRGNALSAQGHADAAIESFDKAITLAPTYADAYYNRGNALLDLLRCEAAIADFNEAIKIRPEFDLAYSNRGMALAICGQLDAALGSFDLAIAVNSGNAHAHYSRGRVLHDMRHLHDAVASYSRAIELRPDYALAYLNRAAALLTMGAFEQGWLDFEWRRCIGGSAGVESAPHQQRPLWRGDQPLARKVILLYGEQGFGDTLQFCRYVTAVAKLGATVILQVQAKLAPLVVNLEGVSVVVEEGKALPEFDFQCPLMSLPRAFGTTLATIPARVRYLRGFESKTAEWRERLGPSSKLRIGLACSGDPTHNVDASEASGRRRDIPLAQLMAHLPDDCEYFCLQPELRASDRSALESCRGNLRCFDDLDFYSTAALCECMDLILSIDTSIAHLGGALGRPIWILLPFNSDWRWLLERRDSPWYPTAKLYRQLQPGDWLNVLQEVSRDIGELRADAIPIAG